MVRRFQVAGLAFSLDGPDDDPVWEQLHNYDPFVISACSEADAAAASGNRATLGIVRGRGPSSDGRGPKDVSGGWLPGSEGQAEMFRLQMVDQVPEVKRQPLYESPKESGEPVVGLWQTENGYLSEFRPHPNAPVCGQLEIGSDFRYGRLYASGSVADRTFAVNNALMLLYAFASAPFSALEMHASVVMHRGRGFLFLGRSGTGKSTHSRLWLKHIDGTELLNDDNPVLRVVDGEARVYGTPWSGKTPCYKAQDVPVGAVVRLSQAPSNDISRLGAAAAYASVMASTSGFRPIRSLADAQHETIATVALQVPCYHLNCLPDEGAARLCCETVDG